MTERVGATETPLDDVAVAVAVVLVPRERLRATGVALDRLRALLPSSSHKRVRIVAVDIANAGNVSRAAREDERVAVLATERFVLPYEARNMALRHLDTHGGRATFVVFVDTDAIPERGCIEALVRAARETGAACVHPLIVVSQAGRERVHAARCVLAPGDAGKLWPRIEGMGEDPTTFPRTRAWDDYGELHLALFSRAALDVIAPFPALSLAEDVAIACKLREAGLVTRSLLEPAARATYAADAVRDDVDRAYFKHRWHERTARTTIHALRALPIDDTYWRDKERWLERHRRLARPAFGWALEGARRVRALRRVPVRGDAAQNDTRDVVVVIPARNAGAFIGEAIASARRQEHVAAIVVVADGASAREDQHAAVDGADLVIHLHEHAGAAAARNRGVREALASDVVRGRAHGGVIQFLCFLDADDRLRDDALARLRARALAEGAVLAYGEATPIDERGARIGADRRPVFAARPRGDVRRSLLAANPIATTGAALVALDAFTRAGGFPEALPRAHDWALWCRIAALGAFAYEPNVVVERRWHAASISSTVGLSMDAALAAVDFVFDDPLATRDLDARTLASLRTAQEASAFALAGTEQLKLDNVAAARPLFREAFRRRVRARDVALFAFTCAAPLLPSLVARVPSPLRARLR